MIPRYVWYSKCFGIHSFHAGVPNIQAKRSDKVEATSFARVMVATEKESCLFLSEWEVARRDNHAIRRKHTEGCLSLAISCSLV